MKRLRRTPWARVVAGRLLLKKNVCTSARLPSLARRHALPRPLLELLVL